MFRGCVFIVCVNWWEYACIREKVVGSWDACACRVRGFTRVTDWEWLSVSTRITCAFSSECFRHDPSKAKKLKILLFFITAAMGPCRLFSPLFPLTFPNDMTCTWIITVPEGHFVKLKITSFSLAHVCSKTTLEIRDGQSSSSDLLKTFCGSSFESSLFSSGRHLWVRFHSAKDEFLNGTGFNSFFEMVSQCKLFCYNHIN